MKFRSRLLTLLLVLSSAIALVAVSQTQKAQMRSFKLHNSWSVSPIGDIQTTGDMLLSPTLSPDGKRIAIVNAGYNAHNVLILDSQNGHILQKLGVKSAWNGIAWSHDGERLFVSGGGSPVVLTFKTSQNGEMLEDRTISIPGLSFSREDAATDMARISGLALSKDGKTLFVANFPTSEIFALDADSGNVTARRKLEKESHPYSLRLSPAGDELFVGEIAAGRAESLNPETLNTIRTIPTLSHPNDLLFTEDGRMFVSCGNTEFVESFDLKSGKLLEKISVGIYPNSPAGATPNSLALSPDGKKLFVANANQNAVAVIDIALKNRGAVEGFIPTGWYPTAVITLSDGKSLLIGSSKGLGTGANGKKIASPLENVDSYKDGKYPYIATLLSGRLQTVSIPTRELLATETKQVLANSPFTPKVSDNPISAPARGSNPIPSRLGDLSPIKNVLYIIKENRTYDQVLGDIKKGNGDPALTIFGEKITPNIHKLANEYVLLDNVNCSGEVSGNGHPWSTAAIGTDIGERSWMLTYSGRAGWALTDKDLYPPVGRIWDACERKGIEAVSYYFTWTTDNTRHRMPKEWDAAYKSSRDYELADLYIRDLKKHEATGKLPRFTIMSLHEDHTSGTKPGEFTPNACVASNDLAVGKIVEACSRSKFWKQMAIFVIEDDAQDGADHVDAHRTPCLVISPYTRFGKVDSTLYQTASLLRTMELILGVPPLSQFDAAATPMYRAFRKTPDFAPFKVLAETVDLQEKNTSKSVGAAQSSKMNFSEPDRLTGEQADQLNRILWRYAKGDGVPYPKLTSGESQRKKRSESGLKDDD